MTNKTIESPSTSVSKDAPVSKNYDAFDAMYKIAEELDTDEITEFYDSWFEKARFKLDMSLEEEKASRFVRKVTAYVLGLLTARKSDDRYRRFANSLKNEDDEVIRAVSEFAQGLRNAVEASMESTPYTSTKKECKKLLNWLDNYNDTVLKPAYEMLPPDGSSGSASGTSLESIAERVMDDYLAGVDPVFRYLPKYYVSQLIEVSGMMNLKEKSGAVNGNTLKSRLHKLNDELYRDRDEDTIGYVLDVMDRIGEAVEEFGANATDARSKWQYENFKNQLDIINDRFLRDRRRNRFFRPSAEQPGQSEQSPSEQYIMVPPSSGDALAIGPDEHAGGVEFLDEEQPPVEQPPVEQPEQPEQPPVEQPPVEQPEQPEQPPVEQPPVEQPPVEQPPVEQPPVEQPPVEQPPAGYSNKDEFAKALEDAMDKVLDPWRNMVEDEKEYRLAIGEGEDEPTNLEAIAGRVIEYTKEAMAASQDMMVHARKNKQTPHAGEARSRFNKIIDTLKKEKDRDVVEDVYTALSRMSEKVEEFRANAPDDDFEKICNRYAKQTDIAKTRVAFPSYQRRQLLETREQRAERLNRVALELGVPQQVMTDTLHDLSDFEQDALYGVIDALNDVYSAEGAYGKDSDKDKEDRIRNFNDAKELEQKGLLKARKALSECYSELGEDSVKRLMYEVREIYRSLSKSPDDTVRTLVAGSLGKVLGQMSVQHDYDTAERDYNVYLSEIPGAPDDWGPDSDKKLKDLENLNDELEYILSRDGTSEGIGAYFPANVSDPLRFLVEHYIPPMKDQAAFENWKNTDPLLRELAKAYPLGVDEASSMNLLAPLLQDAQRYFTDTHLATPYERFMSKLADESERTQKMMARNDFRFERYEYIKRLRQAYGIRSKKHRGQVLNGILDDMSKDITGIRNLGASANDPLPRNLKGDMVFLREGANKFKKDLEQLRDAVTRMMNDETVEPPGWTGFRNWEELLDPNNPLDGRAVDSVNAMKAWEEEEALHTMRKRKYIPMFEARDMWNNPEGDPLRIMRELRGRNIIPGAHPEYSTQPIIGPQDFKELSAMVGPGDGRNIRSARGMNPEEYEELLHAFSQKALYIANNLAFDLRNEADAEAVRQFEQALEIAGRCRGGGTAGASRRGMSYDRQYRMFHRALRD